jgi:uncharacterized protein
MPCIFVDISNRTHLEKVQAEHKAGFFVLGGAYMSSPPKEGETPPMIGSALIAVAETKEEVLDRLRSDVYTTSGVWDVDKVQIWPFRSAIRSGL